MPAMQARTVLLPAPEAPNRPKQQPRSRLNWTSTLSCRRFLMMRDLSMALTLSKHVDQPGKRQCGGQKHDEQRHHRRQTKALQIHPELDRDARRIVRSHHDGAKFADGSD